METLLVVENSEQSINNDNKLRTSHLIYSATEGMIKRDRSYEMAIINPGVFVVPAEFDELRKHPTG